MNASNQVVLLGLDGLDRSEVGEWIDDGTLSTLHSIRDQGVLGDLESTVPPWTPCAWPSLLTGRDPGEHGVFDFFSRDGYEKTLVDRRDVRAPYLWEVADAHGLTTLTVNFPLTHPVTELRHGALVPGYLATEDVSFYPSELRDDFEAEYGEYRIYPEYDAATGAVDEYTRVARCRRDMARLLDERFDWDLLSVQFQVTDSVFHDLDDSRKIRRVLQAVDSYLGDIIALADSDPTVFVASDHGMGDYDWTFYVNSWLADRGYCRTTAGDPKYFRTKKAELRGDQTSDASTALGQVVEHVATALSVVGVTPRDAQRALSAVGLAGVVERVLPDEALVAGQNQTVDWDNSEAFQILFNSLGVHLNVENREPSGRIQEDQYEEFRDRLMSELRTVTDPDDARVFDAVEPREEVYSGSNVDLAPDIVLVPRDYRYDVSGSMANTFRRNAHKNHKPDGLFLVNQPPADGTDLTRVSIYDVAPTVAACLGIPLDSDADGRVLPVVDEPSESEAWGSVAESYRPAAAEGAEKGSDGDVEQRLADLGYLE